MMRWFLLVAVAACSKTDPKPPPAPIVVEAPKFPVASELPPPVPAAPSRAPIHDTPLRDKVRDGHEVGETVTIARPLHRAIDPSESKQAVVLDLTPGLHGKIVGFASRQVAGTTLDVALVKWDAQPWHVRLAAPIDRMKDGVAYGADDLAAMNAQTGDSVDEPSFVAGLFMEELD